MVCEGDRRDARPRSQGPADAAGGVQTDGRTADAHGRRAEAGRSPPSVEGAGDGCCALPASPPLLQSQAAHPAERRVQAAAEDAQR